MRSAGKPCPGPCGGIARISADFDPHQPLTRPPTGTTSHAGEHLCSLPELRPPHSSRRVRAHFRGQNPRSRTSPTVPHTLASGHGQQGDVIEGFGGFRLTSSRPTASCSRSRSSLPVTAQLPPRAPAPAPPSTSRCSRARCRPWWTAPAPLSTGDSFDVPANTPHQMAADGPARVRWEVRPSLRTAEFFERLYGGGADEHFLEEFSEEFRLASPRSGARRSRPPGPRACCAGSGCRARGRRCGSVRRRAASRTVLVALHDERRDRHGVELVQARLLRPPGRVRPGTRGTALPTAPVAPAVRQATRAPAERPPTISGRPAEASARRCSATAVHAASSWCAGAGLRRPATR